MLGLGVMILALAVIRGFKQEITQKVRGFAGDVQVLKFDLNNSYENSPFPADAGFVAKELKDPLITAVTPFATKPGIIKANTDIEGVVFKGVDKTYNWQFFRNNLLAGNILNFKDTIESRKELLISQTTANRLRLKVGNKILMYFIQEPLRWRRFTITGIYNTGIEEVDKTYVIGDLALINRLNNWKADDIGGYEIKVADFNKLKDAVGLTDNLLPTRLKSYSVTDTYPTIFAWLGLLDGNTNVVLSLMIIVAVINMISALLIMILERTAMIGILKAMGATNWGIQKVFLYNALYLIGLGILFGNLFGIGLGYIQQQSHLFKLDQESYYMSFVPIQFNWFDLIVVNAGTLLICLLVMIGPSMLVTRINPVKAIQFK